MNDGDPLNERPDPKEGYGDMAFDELHRFIEHSLKRRSSGNPNPADPSTEEEYFSLLGLLREKDPTSMPHHNAQSKRPSLDSLRQKWKKTELFLIAYRDDPSTSRKSIRNAERRWDELGREIRDREDELRYDGTMYKWPSIPEPTALSPSQMVERLRRRIERAFRPVVAVTQYQWEAVPAGENPVDAIARSFKEWKQRNPRVIYDEDRIEKARSLKPTRAFTGNRKFDGYFIYTFHHTEEMIMECPIYGNAIFVLGSSLEPEQWLQMKKRAIMEHPDSTRIPHREGWFEKVKVELGAPEGG